MARFRDKSTGDQLVLLVAGTVCFTVLGTVATVAIIEIFDSKQDTSVAVKSITGIINTLIGLLAGFLAGRTDMTMNQTRPKGEERDPE